MIELLSTRRCTACNICVSACPTGVFEAVPDGPPRIARPEDCQTCFMCELYCPADALYVAPEADRRVEVDEQALIDRHGLGSYRRGIGWGDANAADSVRTADDRSFLLLAHIR